MTLLPPKMRARRLPPLLVTLRIFMNTCCRAHGPDSPPTPPCGSGRPALQQTPPVVPMLLRAPLSVPGSCCGVRTASKFRRAHHRQRTKSEAGGQKISEVEARGCSSLQSYTGGVAEACQDGAVCMYRPVYADRFFRRVHLGTLHTLLQDATEPLAL